MRIMWKSSRLKLTVSCPVCYYTPEKHEQNHTTLCSLPPPNVDVKLRACLWCFILKIKQIVFAILVPASSCSCHWSRLRTKIDLAHIFSVKEWLVASGMLLKHKPLHVTGTTLMEVNMIAAAAAGPTV